MALFRFLYPGVCQKLSNGLRCPQYGVALLATVRHLRSALCVNPNNWRQRLVPQPNTCAEACRALETGIVYESCCN